MGNDFDNLKAAGIFPLAVGGGYLVYVPLSDSCLMADAAELHDIDRLLAEGGLQGSPYAELVSAFLADAESHEFCAPSPSALTNISILPTWSCNFACTYCYAAKAHRRGVISMETVRTALDYFFFKVGQGDVALQILGGGEPFLEWKLVRDIAAYARSCERTSGRGLTMSIATNGSILSDDIIADIRRYDIRLSFSFEILEDIQNRQRGSYRKVHGNLLRLLSEGFGDRIFLRTVITPASVSRMGEMLDRVLACYPEVCGVIAEPVMGADNFPSVDAYHAFCREFYDNFSMTRIRALRHGVNFTTMVLRNVDFSIDRSCEGDFCVTPDGLISVCHRLASPGTSEADAPDCYGHVADGVVAVDGHKYLSLIGPAVSERQECRLCFAKYNCGGGCVARNLNETPQTKAAFCELTRRLLRDELVRRYDLAAGK